MAYNENHLLTVGAAKQIHDNLKSATTNHLVSDEIKTALLACVQHVAWADEDGQDYYDALSLALNPPQNLVSISAVYTQTGIIYTTTPLSALRSDLVVTAHYSDDTSAVIHAYILTGTLSEGESVVTVLYGGKTDTFTVDVTDATLLYELPQPVTFTGSSGQMIDTGVVVMPQARDTTFLIRATPSTSNTSGFLFYTGMTSSPYNSIGLKCYNGSTHTCPYVETPATAKAFQLTNYTYGNELRVVIRYTQGASGVEVLYRTEGTIYTGATTAANVVAPNNTMKIGDFASSGGVPYVGDVDIFRVYARKMTDEEVYAFLDTGV